MTTDPLRPNVNRDKGKKISMTQHIDVVFHNESLNENKIIREYSAPEELKLGTFSNKQRGNPIPLGL
jgi:hypothetical protein